MPPLDSQTAQAHLGKGYQYIEDQRYRDAAQEFRAALDVDPSLVRARYQLAVCYFALGERKESRAEFQRLRTATQDNPSVIYYLGRLDLVEGELDSAIGRLKQVVNDPPFPDTAYYLGSAYLEKKELEQAERWLRKAAQLDPKDFRVPEHLARVSQKQGRREAAEREFARSAEMRRRLDDTTAQAVSCSRELETRPVEEARVTCQRLFEADDSDKLTTLGMLYGNHGDYPDAVKPLARAAELDPDSPEIQHDLGLTYFRLKRYPEARGPLQRAVEGRPDFFGSQAVLGATLYVLKEDAEAYRVLDRAHQLNPQDQDTMDLLFKTAVGLARARLDSKEYVECLKYLVKAEELRPADAEIHRYLAQVYRLLGQRAKAESEMREAERIETRK